MPYSLFRSYKYNTFTYGLLSIGPNCIEDGFEDDMWRVGGLDIVEIWRSWYFR